MIYWNENAKAAVKEFAEYVGQTNHCERYLERIVPTQKTVADAVEYYNSNFPEGHGILGIAYSNNKITPYYSGSPIADGTCSPESYIICTREQFEAYVKEQESKITMDDINEHISTGEQEGEKWTHVLWGDKAYIKISEPDCDGYLLVITEGNGYNLAKMEDLKPIKPTISKAEAWDILNKIDGREEFEPVMKKVMELHKRYNII